GVDQHDEKNENNYNLARVDNALHRRDKLRSHQQIQSRERYHHHDERKRAVDRMLLENQADCTNHRECGEHKEDDERRGHWRPHCIFAKITKLVRMTFTMETGSKSFQPKAINWS